MPISLKGPISHRALFFYPATIAPVKQKQKQKPDNCIHKTGSKCDIDLMSYHDILDKSTAREKTNNNKYPDNFKKKTTNIRHARTNRKNLSSI